MPTRTQMTTRRRDTLLTMVLLHSPPMRRGCRFGDRAKPGRGCKGSLARSEVPQTSGRSEGPPAGTRAAAHGGRRRAQPGASGGDEAAEVVGAGHHRGIAPEALQVVELALGVEEDVHHEVDEIEQDPAGFALALAAQGADTLGAAGAFDLFGDGADAHVTGLLGGRRLGGGEGVVEAGRQSLAPCRGGWPDPAAAALRATAAGYVPDRRCDSRSTVAGERGIRTS